MKKFLINKSQYNRIFASGLLSESEMVKGGLTRVDKAFKKEFTGSDIKNMTEESDFEIKDRNPSLPSGIQKFNKPLKEEIKKLIKYLYRKDENFSPFWTQNGITYEDICEYLSSKGMIKSNNGVYEISKNLGMPEDALSKIEEALSEIINNGQITELDNLPVGADKDPRAPWRGVDDKLKDRVGKGRKFRTLAMNREIAILKSADDKLVFDFYSIPESFEDEFEVDDYVNSNDLTIGTGLKDYEIGNKDLYVIDEPLKNMLLSLYDKPYDKSVIKALSEINEIDTKKELQRPFKEKPKDFDEKSDEEKELIKKKLADLRAKELARRGDAPEVKETTGASSSGAFTGSLGGSMIKKEMPVDTNNLDVPVVGETTTASSSGQYTAPAFDMKNNTEFSNKKPKAFKKTQYADGGFVDFDKDCVGLNNSKKAQQGGCSQGEINNVVKVRKTNGNVNAPSLGENKK